MLPLFLAAFFVGGAASIVVQRMFYEGVARDDPSVISDAEVSRRVLRHASTLGSLVPAQTVIRLRALGHRQSDPSVERLRVAALVSGAVMLGGFLGIGLVLMRFVEP